MLCLVCLICCCSFSSCDIFFASIDYRSFACSLTRSRAEAKKGCSPFGGKIRVQNEVLAGARGGKYHFASGDFSAKRQKNSPAPHVSESEQARLPELRVRMSGAKTP